MCVELASSCPRPVWLKSVRAAAGPRAAGFVKYCAVIHPLNCTVVCVEYGTVVSCNFLVAPRGCVCESVCGLPFSLPVLA